MKAEAGLTEGLGRVISSLGGTPVLLSRDVPGFSHPAPQCLLRLHDCRVSISAVEEQRRAESQVFEALDNRANVMLWDPVPILCSADACSPAATDGEVLYRDEDHLTQAAAARLVVALDAAVSDLLTAPNARAAPA